MLLMMESCSFSWGWATSNTVPVELRPVALAVDLERALVADGVGPLEDPVLPGREPPEDAGVHGLVAVEAQIGLHAGERVGAHRHAFLDCHAHLVGPVDVVR